MRRHSNRRNSWQNKIIIFSVMGLLAVMTAGYAAFQTQININAKGNILKNSITTEKLKENVVTSGDGLYVDTAEEGRYIYKGTNPDNYVDFNDELWRIISIENDGSLKIIKYNYLDIGLMWDADGESSRDSAMTENTYCEEASLGGCNAWAATTNLVGTPTYFTLHYPNGNPTSDNETLSGTVTTDAYLNTYLNGEYYNSLTTLAQSYIVSHNFNVGTPGSVSDTEDIATNVTQEALYKWTGKVGLITATEFMRTTTNTTCTSLSVAYNDSTTCGSNNWMLKGTMIMWTLSPSFDPSDTGFPNYVFAVSVNGTLTPNQASSMMMVLPVVYLNSNIKLSGNGQQLDPYIIVG